MIPSQAIALANIEVAKATRDKIKKRLPSILPDKINVVASNTAGPFKLFHDELPHIHCELSPSYIVLVLYVAV